MRVGILPLGRLTFDVPFAEQQLSEMLSALDQTDHEIVGSRALLTDGEMGSSAVDRLKNEGIDRLLVLQVTFTDASQIVSASAELDVPLSIWSVPEPRIGGRLRLNSFCGLNLASHALSLNAKPFSWLYKDPTDTSVDDLAQLLSGENETSPLEAVGRDGASELGAKVQQAISKRRIARIGARPDGFHTCDYDKDTLHELAGVEVEEIELNALFDRARVAPERAVGELRSALDDLTTNATDVDQAELDRSLRLKVALDEFKSEKKIDAFALRCWPETFTEYGGAVCGPASMLGEARTPCACEADVYGSLSQMILQEVADAPVFLADLVDLDVEDNTGVVWHCGQAPMSMIDPDVAAEATIHTNRKMPLLFEFPLKPGPVTLMRISQAHGEQKMVIARGEMLKRPMAFTGTSGVLRFERDAGAVLKGVMDSGLEHHMTLAYGAHSEALFSVAAALKLPVIEL